MKTTINYYEVIYTKKIGGQETIIVKGNNEAEALNHAKYQRHTGSDFKVLRQVEPTDNTAKGAAGRLSTK